MFLNIVYFDSAEYCLKFKDFSVITPLNLIQYYKKNQESSKEKEKNESNFFFSTVSTFKINTSD